MFGWRTGAREKAQGHREVLWLAGTLSVTWGHFSDSPIFFPIAPVDRFPINRGRGGEGGGFGTFFSEFFFFFVSFGGGEGGG